MSDSLEELFAETFAAPIVKAATALAEIQRTPPRVGKVETRGFAVEKRSVNEEKRTIEFVASTETPDRYGDILRVRGWDLKNYRKNPVFLFGHRSTEPPIGRTVSIRTEAIPVPALVQTVEFADAKTYPFADTIFRLYKGGYMNAVSVGFRPIENPSPIIDENGRMSGYEFTKQELLELSAVALPANVDAVAREFAPAITDGVIARDEMESFLAALEGDSPATDSDFDALHRAYGRLLQSVSHNPSLTQAVQDIGHTLNALIAAARNKPIASVEELERLVLRA